MSKLGKRTNSSFDRRLKKASEDTSDFTIRLIKYWKLCYQTSDRKKDARKVLNAFAMMNYIFLMNLVIKHLFQHLSEIVQDIKSQEGSITYQVGYIYLIELGQRILESIMPKTSYDPERPLPNDPDKTFVPRVSGYTEEECIELRVQFKDVLRKLYEHLDSKTKCSLNRGGRLWIDCDDTALFIPLDEYLSMCDICNEEVCSCDEETPSDPVQASDPLQALATELTKATISFGPKAEQFACKFLGKGIFQLSDLSCFGEETFASIVKEIGLNEVQVLKLSAFRKK